MIKIGLIQKTWALARRMLPGPAPASDVRAPLDVRKDPEGLSSGMAHRNAVPITRGAPIPSPSKAAENDVGAASLSSETQHEAFGTPTDMNTSLEVMAEQMLTLVEVVSAQEKDIKALKTRCQQLEEHDQAIMVAFTTFFHVLAAKRIARLEDISAILHNIIKTAQHEAHPQESIRLLQRLATMLHEQSEAVATEGNAHGSREADNDRA